MTKKANLELIDFRAITDNDLEFLYQVYADTRAEEMAMTGWDEQQKEEFLRMQFNLQHKQYMDNYKGAQFDIILFNKVPAGRLYVHRKADDIRIIDIALLHQFRRQGIGSKIMLDLIAEADEKKLPLSLHVEHNNPAMGLYERLGFEKGDMINGIYYFMKRLPSAATEK
jgi:ribosomal protein S18 acetylase RimI-like enzyme